MKALEASLSFSDQICQSVELRGDRFHMPSSASERVTRPLSPIFHNDGIQDFSACKTTVAEEVNSAGVVVEVLKTLLNHDAFATWAVHRIPPDDKNFNLKNNSLF
jgi:hypothetical protein